MFRILTSGESHGKCMTVIIDGFPHGVPISEEYINVELKRRMVGYGRGGRMKIESDRAEFVSGVRKGLTLGSPICVLVKNRDYENWMELMEPFGEEVPPGKRVVNPRPGHADLAGLLKRGAGDVRDVLERASARDTAARVAAGAVAKTLLSRFDIHIESLVTSIGKIRASKKAPPSGITVDPEKNELRMADEEAVKRAKELIDDAKERGDTLGGSFEVSVTGAPPGLGDYTQWDRRLDGKLARALISIPAIKGVEVGDASRVSKVGGAKAHDRIYPGPGKMLFFERFTLPFRRKTNRAGGLEGGMTNGEEVVLSCSMKPIPTLTVPLETVSVEGFTGAHAVKERSDVCAVPAASVVAESMVALVLSEALLEKFGCDSLSDMQGAYENYLERTCLPSQKG